MQENRLFINGIEMQLSDRTKIGVTLQANDIGELQNRQGSFTNTFRIRLNAYNKAKLEQAHVMTSATQLPYQKHRIDYYEGALNIMPNAEGIIKNSDGKWIYIDAVGGNVNLSRSIGDVTIGELFNTQVHAWNFTNVVDSRDGSEFYIYPFIDWRTDETTFFDTPTVNPSKMLPCCRVQEVFNVLESLTGHTFTGSYISSPEHRNMVITPDELTINPEYFDDVVLKATELDPSLTTTTFDIAQGTGTVINNSPLSLLNNDPGFFQGYYYPTGTEVGSLRVRSTINMIVRYPLGGIPINKQTKEYWVVVQIKEGGTVIAEITYPHEFIEPDPSVQYQVVIDVQTPEITMNLGDQYFVNIQIYSERHSNADTQIIYGLGSDGSTVSFEKSPENRIVYGSDIRFVDLFRMKAVDVLKDILNKRGLIIQTNGYSNEVSFNYFDDLIKNKAIALDWSELVQPKESKALFYKFGSYGQRNNFKFKESDQVSEGLGDWFFTINDETLNAEVDAVQLNHSATEQTPKYQGQVIPEIEAITTDLNEWNNPGWRLLQVESLPTSYNVTYDDGTNSQIETTNIPFARFVGFESLVPDYYSALQGILDSAKVMPLVLKLTPDLIQNLNHVIPIEINRPDMDISGFFYINVINRYQGGNTLVELVRL
jgi:hypothetical protein